MKSSYGNLAVEVARDRKNVEQRTTILVHLLRTGPLTQPEALSLGIWRLAARCCELQKLGWRIEKRRLPGGFVEYNLNLHNPRADDQTMLIPFD